VYWYLCAVMASRSAWSDPVGARKFGRASIGLSVAGIIVTVLIIIIAIAVVETGCPYAHNGVCYKHRDHVAYSDCWRGVQYGGYCYYN